MSCEIDITSNRDDGINISDHVLRGYNTTAISIDSRGTAWVGTLNQGLVRYDGKGTIYNSSNSALPDDMVIWDVVVDHDDNVWIGSDIGLIKFDRKDFIIYNTSNSPIAEDIVWSIAVDRENILWLASCRFGEGGLMRFDGENWTLFTPENSSLPTNMVQDVAVDSQNNIWLALSETVDHGSIAKISGENWEIYNEREMGFTPYYFNDLVVGKDDNVYASITYVLSSYIDMERPNIVMKDDTGWFINNPVDERGASLGYVGNISTDLNGNVWASLHGKEDVSLAFFNGRRWIYNRSSLPVSWNSEIVVDKFNTAWVGTWNGIYLVRQ